MHMGREGGRPGKKGRAKPKSGMKEPGKTADKCRCIKKRRFRHARGKGKGVMKGQVVAWWTPSHGAATGCEPRGNRRTQARVPHGRLLLLLAWCMAAPWLLMGSPCGGFNPRPRFEVMCEEIHVAPLLDESIKEERSAQTMDEDLHAPWNNSDFATRQCKKVILEKGHGENTFEKSPETTFEISSGTNF